jgi:hypothetical protein
VIVSPGQHDVAPTGAAPWEIALRCAERFAHGGWELAALGAIVALLAIALWSRFEASKPAQANRAWPAARAIGIAIAIACGLALAASRASLVDDAFISFRYADNWAHGRGPVFNPGELVQGYTNFLWMALLALGSAATGAEPSFVALVLGPLAFVANILVLAALGRSLAVAPGGGSVSGPGVDLPRPGRHVPLAAGLFAVNGVATQYATTGLETGAASLCVDLGIWAALARSDTTGAFLSGLAFTLASLFRLDQGLFQAAGLAIVAWRTRSLRQIAAFLAPALLLVGYGIWARATYGEVFPNTLAAKASGPWEPFQAGLYAEIWLLGSEAWIPVAIASLWAWSAFSRPDPGRRERPLAVALLATTAVWQIWLLRIGGDFMYGRFYQSLFPLFLVAAERAAHQGSRWARVAGVALAASALAASPLRPGYTEWYIADEPTFYPLIGVSPPVVDHHSYRIGELLRTALRDRNIRPVIATSGPGMIAYLSDLTTIDVLGLTDRHVARSPSLPDARPGHAKQASYKYLIQRNVRFGHVYPQQKWTDVTRLDLTHLPGAPEDWFIVTYDPKLMRRIAEVAPEIGFVDFERWLDDYVERALPTLTPAEALSDLQWMDNYYFHENGDGAWRQKIADAAGLPRPPAR